MSRRTSFIAVLALAIITIAARPGQPATTGWTITGWNNLGMHCMDADFSVFAILPPYNTIHAQVVDASGNLVTSAAGITVTYQAIADPTGSINTTSVGKDNFWAYAASLFGLAKPLPPDVGLTGVAMPGMMNAPQPMTFDPANDWFIAEGIPITPYDDAGHKNTYPMMRLVARDSAGNVLATTDIVLPISDEMDCRACHASGSSSAARPLAGWVNDPDPIRDYRLNILRLHDDRNIGSPTYTAALSNAGYSSTGLYDTVVTAGKPVLCAACHGSNALAGTGQAGIPPLTQSIHSYHAQVTDPVTNMTLDSSSNRSACYRCHPGSTTKCLRGAMGSAVAADGSMEMQCQNCHGPMHSVGTAGRQGWLDEPNCQSCHTGTAASNNGQIRYTSVFDASGQTRIPVDTTFATNPNTPSAGYSLYRFSKGHGGLACSACHGSTHAEFPTSHANDNIQSVELQGHKGMLVDCTTCHGSQSLAIGGGPHGMHPVGQSWVSSHGDAADGSGAAQCQACHGTDYRGTVLSRAQGDRTISAYGTKLFWQGFQIGCYTCHNGPDGGDSGTANPPATVSNASASTTAGTAVTIPLSATDPTGNALTLRVVSQPANGTAGLAGTNATYYPDPSFSGTDTFTYAAWNGSTDSNLGTVTVTVAGGAACIVTAQATVPTTATVGQILSFQGSGTEQGCSTALSYAWTFGDGSSSSQQSPTHAYASANTYTWTLTVSSGASTNSTSGTVTVTASACTVTAAAVVPSSATVGSPTQFQGSGTEQGCDTALTYAWTFGDGSSSSQQSPTHAYASANTYTWTLTVSSGSSSSSTSGTVTVTAAACALFVTGTVPTSANVGQSVKFPLTVTSSGCEGTISYRWSFGDGSDGSKQAQPTHTYRSAGTFTWRLNATLGSTSTSATGTIAVSYKPHREL